MIPPARARILAALFVSGACAEPKTAPMTSLAPGAAAEAVRRALRETGDTLRLDRPEARAPLVLISGVVTDSTHVSRGGRPRVRVRFTTTTGVAFEVDAVSDRARERGRTLMRYRVRLRKSVQPDTVVHEVATHGGRAVAAAAFDAPPSTG